MQKELEDEAAAHAAADAEEVTAAVAAAEVAAGEAIRLRLGTVVEGVGSALHGLEGVEGGVEGGAAVEEAAGSRGTGHRVVDRNDSFVAFVPFAAPSPFSIYIVPLRPTAHFLDSTEAEREDLAEVMWRALRRLHVLLREPDYNMVLRSAPLAGRHRQRAVNADAYVEESCVSIMLYPVYTLYTPALPHMHLCAPIIHVFTHVYTSYIHLTHLLPPCIRPKYA